MTKSINPQLLHDLEERARDIGRKIGSSLPAGCGFGLLIFSYDGAELTWVSNAEREGMIKALKEFLEKVESGTADELSRPKGSG